MNNAALLDGRGCDQSVPTMGMSQKVKIYKFRWQGCCAKGICCDKNGSSVSGYVTISLVLFLPVLDGMKAIFQNCSYPFCFVIRNLCLIYVCNFWLTKQNRKLQCCKMVIIPSRTSMCGLKLEARRARGLWLRNLKQKTHSYRSRCHWCAFCAASMWAARIDFHFLAHAQCRHWLVAASSIN